MPYTPHIVISKIKYQNAKIVGTNSICAGSSIDIFFSAISPHIVISKIKYQISKI